MSLYQQLLRSIQLGEGKKAELSRAAEDGFTFFSKFNDSRMNLAFDSFSEDMKKALYEVIYFLHVNDEKYEDHTFPATRIEKVHGVNKEVEYEEHCSLYVKGSPAGVVGIEQLSSIFKDDFEKHIMQELGATIEPAKGFAPIYSISSLGSIGTVGHKTTASDLDLQVQYELSDFLYDPSKITDRHLEEFSRKIIGFFSRKFIEMKKITQEQLKNKTIHGKVIMAGKVNFKKRFPIMFSCLVQKNENALRTVMRNIRTRQEFAHELIDIVNFYMKVFLKKQITMRENLLKDRIMKIQDYVQKKYPKAEVYLFAYSNDNYRDGKHGTTLESKEASGSAYELILNYETLMPGIQFTPTIPIHFLMTPIVNEHRDQYERLVHYIRFHFTDLYDTHRTKLVDLGSTPPLTLEYMIAHSGAVYWESFKASSGNLPKALLNLLRLEMLFDQRFNTSIIELIKSPRKLDQYVAEKTSSTDLDEEDYEEYDDDEFDDDGDGDDFFDDFGSDDEDDFFEENGDEDSSDLIGEDETIGGFAIKGIFSLEDKYPLLLMDPWWLRYKALKIAFGPANRTIPDPNERALISKIIDLGFALHVRISDVFCRPGEKKEFTTYRQKVLVDFLDKAFPKIKRRFLEHIFAGEVDAVLEFENDLKYLFKKSMARVKAIVDAMPGKDQTNQDEFRIWFHYYETHFEPPDNMVRRDILNHLKVPRGRLQVGWDKKKKKWFFKSLQKQVLKKSQYDTFGDLDHLPDEVELFEQKSFLHGLAHCVLNSYYGITNRGTLLESRTHLEFAVGQMSMGKASADKFAFIRPDNVTRMMDQIFDAFPPQEYDYRDCIYKKREVVNIFICLNLLEYGRLSILYRDNLKNWHVERFDHKKIERSAYDFYETPDSLLTSPILHRTIRKFFNDNEFVLTAENRSLVHCWVNPNSVHTSHPPDKVAQKEGDLAKKFGEIIFRAHSGK